ncbi:hypothetical protein IFM89_003695 [Coptis chinensis]|uniref:DUF4283 domain-containing protein n=1 Tax=Coptis chinensis TaxID=261450 RepID=A0A835M8K5_9MAGN|nr:hypothetical protein IFM89_003695 [Coptis chinensis]
MAKLTISCWIILLCLLFHTAFAKTKSPRPISDTEVREKKNNCYADIQSGLWGRECKYSKIATENCALNCLSPVCYTLVYESDPLEEGERDHVRSQEYKYCMHRGTGTSNGSKPRDRLEYNDSHEGNVSEWGSLSNPEEEGYVEDDIYLLNTELFQIFMVLVVLGLILQKDLRERRLSQGIYGRESRRRQGVLRLLESVRVERSMGNDGLSEEVAIWRISSIPRRLWIDYGIFCKQMDLYEWVRNEVELRLLECGWNADPPMITSSEKMKSKYMSYNKMTLFGRVMDGRLNMSTIKSALEKAWYPFKIEDIVFYKAQHIFQIIPWMEYYETKELNFSKFYVWMHLHNYPEVYLDKEIIEGNLVESGYFDMSDLKFLEFYPKIKHNLVVFEVKVLLDVHEPIPPAFSYRNPLME